MDAPLDGVVEVATAPALAWSFVDRHEHPLGRGEKTISTAVVHILLVWLLRMRRSEAKMRRLVATSFASVSTWCVCVCMRVCILLFSGPAGGVLEALEKGVVPYNDTYCCFALLVFTHYTRVCRLTLPPVGSHLISSHLVLDFLALCLVSLVCCVIHVHPIPTGGVPEAERRAFRRRRSQRRHEHPPLSDGAVHRGRTERYHPAHACCCCCCRRRRRRRLGVEKRPVSLAIGCILQSEFLRTLAQRLTAVNPGGHRLTNVKKVF